MVLPLTSAMGGGPGSRVRSPAQTRESCADDASVCGEAWTYGEACLGSAVAVSEGRVLSFGARWWAAAQLQFASYLRTAPHIVDNSH